MKIIYRIYLLLLVALLATAFFFKGVMFDIHVQDTKLVIRHFYISLWLALYVLLLTIVNYWIAKFRNKILFFQWVVFFITALVCFWILYASFFQSTRYYNRTLDLNAWQNFNQFQRVNEITTILLFFFVSIHLAFWIYFLVFLRRKWLHKN